MKKDIFDENLIVINPEVKDKKELFQKMVSHVYENDYIVHEKEFLKALIEREKMANTELIRGVALPHVRSNVVEKMFLCIIISKEGIDYESEEFGPAQIIFFLGSNHAQHKLYLQLLAQSARILKNEELRQKLINATEKSEVIELLTNYLSSNSEETELKQYTMMFTLHETSKSADVLSSLVEAGITNASIIETSSMARKLAYEMPVFAGLSYMAQGKSKQSQLYICSITGKHIAEQFVSILKNNGLDLNKKGVGHIQLIPVESVLGNIEEDIDL